MLGSEWGAGSQKSCRLASYPPSPASLLLTRQSSRLPASLSLFLGEKVPVERIQKCSPWRQQEPPTRAESLGQEGTKRAV